MHTGILPNYHIPLAVMLGIASTATDPRRAVGRCAFADDGVQTRRCRRPRRSAPCAGTGGRRRTPARAQRRHVDPCPFRRRRLDRDRRLQVARRRSSSPKFSRPRLEVRRRPKWSVGQQPNSAPSIVPHNAMLIARPRVAAFRPQSDWIACSAPEITTVIGPTVGNGARGGS